MEETSARIGVGARSREKRGAPKGLRTARARARARPEVQPRGAAHATGVCRARPMMTGVLNVPGSWDSKGGRFGGPL